MTSRRTERTTTMQSNDQELECPACGGYKMSHERYCSECQDYKDRMDAAARQRARQRFFGHGHGT